MVSGKELFPIFSRKQSLLSVASQWHLPAYSDPGLLPDSFRGFGAMGEEDSLGKRW